MIEDLFGMFAAAIFFAEKNWYHGNEAAFNECVAFAEECRAFARDLLIFH